MPRLFTAVEIPPEIGESLSALRGGLPGARWVDPENYHLTLRFIGDVDDDTAHDVMVMLGQVRRRAFELRLSALGQFGGKKPRAVFAAAQASAPLTELQAEHERIFNRMGLAHDQRKFTPHVTLARLRESYPQEVADYLALRGGYRSAPFLVTRFVLFSARASTGGGPYVTEAAYPLDRGKPLQEGSPATI
jgi:2'-5' RNA ligase